MGMRTLREDGARKVHGRADHGGGSHPRHRGRRRLMKEDWNFTEAMSYSMSDLLQLVVSEGSSDLHIRVGVPPVIRVHGILHRVDGPPLRRKTPRN
jgi:hypothetical protein